MLDAVGTPVTRFDTSAVKAIKDTLSIVDLVGDYVALRRRGRIFVGLCPFHDDHRPSLDVDPERQRYRCWACGAVGDIFSFVMAMEKVSFREALERLAERAGVRLSTVGRRSGAGDRVAEQLFEAVRWAMDQFVAALWQPAAGEQARAYLQQRGYTTQTLREFRIGFAPNQWSWLADRARAAGMDLALLARAGLLRARRDGGYYDYFRGRVMFPIFDTQGRPVAFGARVLPEYETPESPKYLNSPETAIFSKGRTLYGLDLARRQLLTQRRSGQRRFVVVEGYTDCMSLVQAGLVGVVGTLGTALTVEHIKLLRRFGDSAVLLFDGDEAGLRAADRAIGLLAETEFDVRVAVLPAGVDPADFVAAHGLESLERILDDARDPLEFRIARAGERFDLSSLSGKRAALDYVLAPLAERGRPSTLTAQESLLLDRVAEALRLSRDTVVARWHTLRPRANRTPRRQESTAEPAPGGPPRMADPLERELLALVLVWPRALELLVDQIPVDLVRDPWLRQMLSVCYQLWRSGEEVTLERLCWQINETEPLLELQRLAELGAQLAREQPVESWLRDVVRRMEERELDREAATLHAALEGARGDDARERELLQRLAELTRARHQRAARSAK